MNKDKSDYNRTHLESTPTVDDKGRRKWIYPDRRSGPHERQRRHIAIALIAFYLVAPWLSFNDLPLLRIDVRQTSFYFFGLALNFSDSSYLFFIFTLGLIALFLATTVKGRIWCGYACPQTVFVEWIIRPIEDFLEGPAARRRVNDSRPLTLELRTRKIVKHICFIVVSIVVANTFLAYFYPAEEVLSWTTNSPKSHPAQFLFMLFIAMLFYLDLTWFREQFCSFLCPYARFQAVMMDQQTPTVAYDYNRGEPRGKRGTDLGDCINCGLCQRVCPTGIDIRNGLQLECIQCMRCVDACNTVMTTLHRPNGLIRQDTMAAIEGSARVSHFRRPRVYFYSILMVIVSLSFGWRLSQRELIDLTIIRQPGTAYSRLETGELANMFIARFSNQRAKEIALNFTAVNPSEGRIICAGCDAKLKPLSQINHPLLLIVPKHFQGEEFEFRENSTGQIFKAPLILPK